MRKIMIIITTVLPILMVMAGCIDNGQQQTAQQPMQQVFFVWDPCSNSWVPTSGAPSPNPASAQQQIPVVAQNIYVQQGNDPLYDSLMLQQMQRQNTEDYQKSLDKTFHVFRNDLDQMNQNNINSLNMLNNARQQQQFENTQWHH